VDELTTPLVPAVSPDPRAGVVSAPLPYGAVEGGTHVPVPDGVLDEAAVQRLTPHAGLVVTPWHGVLVPDGEEDQ
jgi:precorrin-3B synthase